MSINTDDIDFSMGKEILRQFLSNIKSLEYGSTCVVAVVHANRLVELSFDKKDKMRDEVLNNLLSGSEQ